MSSEKRIAGKKRGRPRKERKEITEAAPAAARRPPPAAVQPVKKYGDDVPVWISPVACPDCGSKKIASTPNGSKFYGNLRIRYHQCKECNFYFKSKEYL